MVLFTLHFFFSRKHRIAILLKKMRTIKDLPERPELKTVTTEDVLKRFENEG